jgi:prevent-host-death family protein
VERMKTIALSEAKATLSEIVDTVRRDQQDVVIKKHKKSVAVLVESGRYERLRELDDAVMRLELKKALRGRKYRLEDVLNELSAQ